MVFGFFKSGVEKLKKALSTTRSFFASRIATLFSRGKLDEETLDQLEQTFYEADLGVETATELTKKIQNAFAKNPKLTSEELLQIVRSDLEALLLENQTPVDEAIRQKPKVVLIIGVNGNGKTTTIAKLAKRYKDAGKQVMLAAADTFRAAAIEQLTLWAERLSIPIVKGAPGGDPAAVAFDAIASAKAKGVDVLLIDTAGRLHTKTSLMQELAKIRAICQKSLEGAPHETYLILDANTGQNGIDQAKTFHETLPLTGLILTKLDSTAKGGIVIRIHQNLKVPISYVGLGEGIDDLQPFDPKAFISALFDS